MRKLVRRSTWVLPTLLFACLVGAGTWVWNELTPYPQGVGASAPIYVTVQRGMALSVIARQMHDLGVVRNPFLFTLLGRALGVSRRIKAGDYAFRPGTPPRELLRILGHGMNALDEVTIPEGLTTREIARLLYAHAGVDTVAFMKDVGDPGFAERLGVKAPSLEGYLFPETYAVLRGTRAEDVLSLMVSHATRVLHEEMGQAASPPPYTTHELVTMASIVEAEAHQAGERGRIAAVYYNRLKGGMKLQADPTVAFAMGTRPSRLMFGDLKVDSPYNTYTHFGLPPGPICNPGRASLRAAISPDPSTTALFFVSRGDGTHEFTRTFAQHERAIAHIRGGPPVSSAQAPAAPAPGGRQ